MGNLVTHIWKRFPTLPPAQDFWARMYIMAHGGPSIPFLDVLGGFFRVPRKVGTEPKHGRFWAEELGPVEFLSSCKSLLQSSRCFLSTPIFFGLGGGVFLLEVQYSILKSLISTCVLSYVGSREDWLLDRICES